MSSSLGTASQNINSAQSALRAGGNEQLPNFGGSSDGISGWRQPQQQSTAAPGTQPGAQPPYGQYGPSLLQRLLGMKPLTPPGTAAPGSIQDAAQQAGIGVGRSGGGF